ncbi:LytTR family DNA-binding domain-containing protein [Massilia sp. Leaf139]|uniref:LytR/AlgR family response regulator transcription factor n=1 Tax=Massilia sp. Leaf139 TaxID=1736272 RepID=UPI0006FBC96C|nr:LytTR family DNA-binding domain-containing protein [Massilia sp. Leaf139]KQQ87136.1 LytTR family transcriptional regulator [Massilia sp. Leaf139]
MEGAPIRYAIVDDEEPGRNNLRLAMEAHPGWQLAFEADSAARAREKLAACRIDLLFLDIQMPRESGLLLARELACMSEPPLVVFVTAHNTHAIEAFEVHALDYLLKPLNDARLGQSVERTALLLAGRQRGAYGRALAAYAEGPAYLEQISVRSVGRIDQVRVADIDWCEAQGNYVALHTAAGSPLHRVALSRLEEHLDPAQFLRVHRGVIVRRTQAAGLSVVGDGSYLLRLRGGAEVPVSERYVTAVRELLL